MSKQDLSMNEEDWNEADRQADEANSGDFLKLEPGESAVVAFIAPPKWFLQHWNHAEKKSEPCTKGDCCRRHGRMGRPRFLLEVWVESKEGEKIGSNKIIECSPKYYGTIKTVRAKRGLNRKYEIMRKGSGLDTEYTVIPDSVIDDELREKIDARTPKDLQAVIDRKMGAEASDDVSPLAQALVEELTAAHNAGKVELIGKIVDYARRNSLTMSENDIKKSWPEDIVSDALHMLRSDGGDDISF